MTVSARRLNRATLDRQMLLRRETVTVPEAVRRAVALQAQEPASPYLALWNRVAGFDPGGLDAAFVAGSVVRASLIRLTLHAVHGDDYPAFHRAMETNLRASRLHDDRYRSTGLTIADADALLPEVLAFAAGPRPAGEIESMLEERLGRSVPRLWWAFRMFAPLHHVPTGGPWSFAAPGAFVAADARPGPVSEDEAVARLLLRYLEGFGPASAADFARFTMLRRPVVERALRAVADRVVRLEGPDGAELHDAAGAALPAEDVAAPPRLLPMWDNALLAHADRGRMVPPEYRPHVIRRNGDVLPTLLVDGHVAGVWRATASGIEATAFHPLPDEVWAHLAAEAGSLQALLADRDPEVYRRYGHWWDKGMPAAEVRRLPG